MGSSDNILFSHKNVEAFPVGSVFISVNNTNPNELLGYGTWILISQDKMIMGCNEDDTETSTGGKKSITLSSSQLPSHTHSIATHTHQIPAHNHTGTSSSAGNHGHETETSVAGNHGHKYTMGSSSHSHTITVNSGGSHTHGIKMNTLAGAATHNHSRGNWTKDSSYVSEGTKYGDDSASFFGTNTYVIQSAGSHKHSASSASSSHTHTLSIQEEGAHTHGVSITENGAHTHTITIANKSAFNTASGGPTATGSTGSGSAIDITNPYLKLFIWQRTE